MIERKPRERGYTVVWLTFALIIALDVAGMAYLFWITRLNEGILLMNVELARSGIYSTIYPTFDTSIVITLLGFVNMAYPIVAAAQLKKKQRNNDREYLEAYMDRWMRDPEIQPYAAQMFSAIISVNNL